MHLKAEKLINQNGIYLDGPLLIKPNVFKDERGFFMESWNKRIWTNLLEEYKQKIKPFVQDNHSKSTLGVLRGLHYQKNPKGQGKLVRCIAGEIYDVAVDIRKNSQTFGKYVGAYLSSTNFNQLWIPIGFAHGFLTISEIAEVAYKSTDFWDKESERSILWNDPNIKIEWPRNIIDSNEIKVSEKDSKASLLNQISLEDLF